MIGVSQLFVFLCASSRSRRQLAALNKDCQFGFSTDAVDETTDLDPTIAYYQLDDGGDGVFPPLPVRKPQEHMYEFIVLVRLQYKILIMCNQLTKYQHTCFH